MNKVIVIGVVLLTVLGGGIFLYLLGASSPEPEEDGYSTTPTQWSQAGDYKIEETAEGTVVTNEKAGFSFKVPEDWSIEPEQFTEKEFLINMFSPDAVKQEGNPPLSTGCGIGLTTLFREDLWESWNNDVLILQQNPEATREGESIVEVDGRLALKSALNANDPVAIERLGEIIQVHIPISNHGVIEFGTTMMLDRQSDCKAEFDTFISSFVFN